MSSIAEPPGFKWKRDELAFGDATVELWCPQTEDFDNHGCGDLRRRGGLDKEELEDFTAFQNWRASMVANLKRQEDNEAHPDHERPYSMRSIHINAVSLLFLWSNDSFIQHNAQARCCTPPSGRTVQATYSSHWTGLVFAHSSTQSRTRM